MNKRDISFEGKNIIYRQTVDSTNLLLRRLAEDGSPANSIVFADEQLAGRGRLGRKWFSPPGSGLWFSLLLRPEKLAAADSAPLTLVTAAVIANLLRQTYHLPVDVKWPNDLLISGKKVCGILLELKADADEIEYLIVGIGLNVNQEINDFPSDISSQGTSLYLAGGKKIDRIDLFLALRETLLDAYRLFFNEGFAPFRDLWLKNNITLGQAITVTWPGGKLKGKALALTREGALIIEDSHENTHVVNYGEII